MELRNLRHLQMKSLKRNCNDKHVIFPVDFELLSEEGGGGRSSPTLTMSGTAIERLGDDGGSEGARDLVEVVVQAARE